MLHFFRKIRQHLLTENRFTKYLFYAIGEILLVVIGILIALYINNKNEQRKEQEKFDMVLVDVEKELMDNISMTREIINRLARTDSLCVELFVDSVEFEDKFYNYVIIGMAGGLKTPKDDYFQKLTQINNISIEQDSILDELIGLYREEIYLDRRIEDMSDATNSIYETFKKYDWFENFVSYKFDDDRMIDYFENDPEYRRMAIDHYRRMATYNFELSLYFYEAVPVYKSVRNYLNTHKIIRLDSLEIDYNPNKYKHLLGKYTINWCSDKAYIKPDSIIISIEKGKLRYKGYESDGSDYSNEIIPLNRNRFIIEGIPGINHLKFDSIGDVERVRFSQGPTFIWEMKKVR